MTENFLLEVIADNPYQPRTVDNPEHIENLARSIAADGLLQVPTARSMVMGIQLAFGHSRRKAFEWLRMNFEKEGLTNRYNGYTEMPLNITELSDEDMYRQAVSENVQRKDLDAIETAKAMLVYRDQFSKNSDEIGALFGMSGATVRGKLRLLDLPDTAKAKLQSGELSESAARLLITLSRIAPDDVDGALENIVDLHEDPEEVVDDFLRVNKNVRRIHDEQTFSIKAKSFKHLPVLSEKELAKIEDEEKKLHLITPPACTACPWYARVGGDDYCGLSQCFDRKSEAQAAANLEDASKKTGIAIYSDDDGDMVVLDRWEETHRKAVEKKDADLRLIKAGKIQSYWHYLNNDIPMNVALVAVGKLCEKYKKAIAQSEIDRGRIPDDADPKAKARAIKIQMNEKVVRQEYDRLIFETIAPHFLPMLEPVKNEGLLELLADALGVDNELFDQNNQAKVTGKARIKHLQVGILSELWERASSWNVREKAYEAKLPATELAKTARTMAASWNVTLGKDFDKAVSEADGRINELRQAAIQAALADVSAETPAPKGKK